MTQTPIRDRARIVCTVCHDRKVKCDLGESQPNACSNCRRFNNRCTRRTGRRRRVTKGEQDHRRVSAQLTRESSPLPPPVLTPDYREDGPRSSSPQHGFIAEHSVLARDGPVQSSGSWSVACHAPSVGEAILSVTGAAIPLSPSLRRALTDLYFENLFHQYPIVDPADLAGPNPSILLQQTVCLVGNLMREGEENMKLSHSLYEKVKTLIYLNHERNPLTTLKAMALLSCWSAQRPDTISMDGPWHWTGAAIRQAIQMGLHRESTYTNKPRSGCIRRIFWQLYNSDKFQVACWGRPPLLRSEYIDVKPPCIDDFDRPDIQALLFIHSTGLSEIIGRIAELHLEKHRISPDALAQIEDSLSSWIQDLPEDLRLYSSTGIRKPFHRPVSGIHIHYFAAVIMLQLLQSELSPQQHASLPSLISSSCIARLFEDILLREHTRFLLPPTGFLCMIASLPQLYYRPRCAEQEEARQEEIQILCSVMEQMRGKYGGTDMVLHKIRSLQIAVEHDHSETVGEGALDSVRLVSESSLDRLFPFPASFCPHLSRVDRSGDLEDEFVSMATFVPMGQQWTQWLVADGHAFMDLLDIDPTMSDMMAEGATFCS